MLGGVLGGVLRARAAGLSSWRLPRRTPVRASSRPTSRKGKMPTDGPIHYRGPHPAHCAAWISVGPMVAIKWGLHTRNHTLEDPHTGELVDGDS